MTTGRELRRSAHMVTTKPSIELSQARAFLPEFVPLKVSGGDGVTGMSRSWWYGCEAQGLIKLVRIRKPGQVKPRVLLPVADAVALVRRLSSTETNIVAETAATR